MTYLRGGSTQQNQSNSTSGKHSEWHTSIKILFYVWRFIITGTQLRTLGFMGLPLSLIQLLLLYFFCLRLISWEQKECRRFQLHLFKIKGALIARSVGLAMGLKVEGCRLNTRIGRSKNNNIISMVSDQKS